MPSQQIEEFARILIREVRDQAIASCDDLLDPAARGVVAKRWKTSLRGQTCVDFAREAIPDCVDSTIFFLLNVIDSGLLRLSFKASDGTIIDLREDGEEEMSGWYMASGGWRDNYSEERFVDDFDDL